MNLLGLIGDACVHPVDTIRTRLQAQVRPGIEKSGEKSCFVIYLRASPSAA